MNITKLGHCCLLIETKGVRIVTDPGSFTDAQNQLERIDAIVITHEHGDHFHVASVQAMLARNPNALVISNTAVVHLLANVGIAHTVVEGANGEGAGARTTVKGVSIVAYDAKHEEIFEMVGQVQNTGYLIDGALFYPGDAFHQPGVPVDILALPVAGPWCRLPSAIRYALAVKPRVVIPVHDGMIKDGFSEHMHRMTADIFRPLGIHMVQAVIGKEEQL
jgi:L-ascorbate metabolism protein UlaG (beta-lactamase superfamily)